MANTSRRSTIAAAYAQGLRRCPCCNVQLVWKAPRWRSHPSNVATVDHIIPRSKGGDGTHHNLFVICRRCNMNRGDGCFLAFARVKGIPDAQAHALMERGLRSSMRNALYNGLYHPSVSAVGDDTIAHLIDHARALYGSTLPEPYAFLHLLVRHKRAT